MKKRVSRLLKSCVTMLLVLSMVIGELLGVIPWKVSERIAVAEAAGDILSNEDRGIIYANSRTDFRDETIYFVITTRFYDGDPSNNARSSDDDKAKNPEDDPSWRGDFAGLIEKLDYIKALGFTAIWITPVVQNNSGYDYHGYHAYDFSAVDYRYESNGITYQDLIDAVHEKGMKLIQDVVLNHTCNWGEKNLLKITSDIYTERNQVVMNGKGDPDNLYHHNGFCGGGDWDNYSAQDKTIADDCFDLETENPMVYNYLIDCYNNYINMGVDGFRIDTVKHISRLTFNSTFLPAFKETGGDDFYMFGEVCTKGYDTWYRGCPPISTCFYTWADPSEWTSRWSTDTASNESLVQEHYAYYNNAGVQSTSDNAFLSGNTYHTPDYSEASGMNVIDFQMHWSFNNANSAFNTALGEDKYFNDSTWNVVYVDSHDYAPDNCQTTRYTRGTQAWAENLDLMFTFRGIPCLYYGSEVEFQKGKPIDVGPNAPLSATGRAYFGDYLEGNVDTADFTVFGNLSGTVMDTLNAPLSQHIMRLNRIRQAVPALRKGQYSTEGCTGNMAFKRRYTDSTTDSFALVAISGDATFTGIPNGTYVDAVTGDTKVVTNGILSASVSGKANMKVYVLNTDKTPAPGRVVTNGNYLSDGGAIELIGPVEINIVKPTSITLDKTSVTVLESEAATVTPSIQPSNASKTVSWTSSDTSVATVSGGKITGVSVGTATITATTINGLKATVKVTVNTNPNIVKPTGIVLNNSSVTVKEKSIVSVVATVLPTNAANKTVTWTSSNSKVATVSNGTITGVSAGTATITATTFNGYSARVNVTVEERVVSSACVYFKNTNNWSKIYAYAWSGSSNNGAWPGQAMTCVDEEKGIYAIELDKDAGFKNIIFHNGEANHQTDNLTIPDYEFIYSMEDGWSEYTTEEPLEVTISANTSSVNVGDSVTLTANATGGKGDYTYSFLIYGVEGNEWYRFNSTFTSANTYTWKASKTGTKQFYVEVKDSAGTVVRSSAATVVSSNTVTPLAISASANKSTMSVGDSVTVSATATGGSGSYTYSYLVWNTDTNTWFRFNSTFTSNNTLTWKASSAGNRKFYVEVKDTTGKVVRSSAVAVKVNGNTTPLAVTASSSAWSISKGSSVTITAKAAGGSGSYTYSFLVWNTDTNEWHRFNTTFKTANTLTWKAGSKGNRKFYAEVKDSTGKVVRSAATAVAVN